MGWLQSIWSWLKWVAVYLNRYLVLDITNESESVLKMKNDKMKITSRLVTLSLQGRLKVKMPRGLASSSRRIPGGFCSFWIPEVTPNIWLVVFQIGGPRGGPQTPPLRTCWYDRFGLVVGRSIWAFMEVSWSWLIIVTFVSVAWVWCLDVGADVLAPLIHFSSSSSFLLSLLHCLYHQAFW